MQISSGGIVVKDREILLLKKKNGSYCLPKGHIEYGETLEKTAIREVKEETNIDGNILFYIGHMRYSYRNIRSNKMNEKEVHWFLMEPLSLEPKPQRSEGFIWCGFKYYKQALKLVSYKNERDIIKDAISIYKEIKQWILRLK